MASVHRTAGGWQVRWRDPGGRQHGKTFSRKIDANRFTHRIEADMDAGTYVDPAAGKTRFTDWLEQWHRSRIGNRPTTRARDDSIIRNHIAPAFASHSLASIKPNEIRQWVAGLADRLAPVTVHKAAQLLRACLEAAVTDDLIPRSPYRGITLPRVEKVEHRYLTVEELYDLAATIEPRYRALALAGGLAGLRGGELYALRVTDLDLLGRKLTVAQTLRTVRGQISVGPPKTDASRRTMTIPKSLADELAAHLAQWPSNGFVFTAPQGGPVRVENFRRRVWRPAVQASVGEPCNVHDLRHTHAALAIESGMHPKVLSARLGHSSIRVTFDVYGGLFPGADGPAVEALEDAIRNRDTTPRRVMDFSR